MYNPFQSGHSWYPIRWFLVILAVLTMGMTYVDYTGYRFLGAGGRYGAQQPGGGYSGSHYYFHK